MFLVREKRKGRQEKNKRNSRVRAGGRGGGEAEGIDRVTRKG